MDRGAWRATVQSVAKSQTQLKRLSTHARKYKPTIGLKRRHNQLRLMDGSCKLNAINEELYIHMDETAGGVAAQNTEM